MKLVGVTILGAILTLLRMASGLLVSKFVAIYGGPTGVALVGQLQSFIAGINGLATNQISQGVVRFSAENKDSDAYRECIPFWRAAVFVIYISLGIAIPLLCIFSEYLSVWLFDNKDLYWLIIVAALALPFNVINSLLLAVLNGIGENRKNITTSMVSISISSIFTFVFLYFFGISGGLVAIALNNAIAAVIVFLRVRKSIWFSISYWFGPTDKKNVKELRKYLVMGVVGALTGPTAMVIVRNIISEHTSLFDVGLWQAVMRISDAYIAMITIGVGMYYFPKVASIKHKRELLDVTVKVVMFVGVLVTSGAALIFILKSFIINLLFTPEFLTANDLFKPQLLADIFKVLSFVPASILLAKGYIKLNIAAEIIVNLIFVSCSLLLVDKYGVIGANYAYLLTYILYFIFSYLFFVYHYRKLPS
ncbi:O-antigen translocase [Photobacterium angustum]|uniref:O-antigen translocase n=1 Tax=Photobacterium angustum TaxID=661 RepID=UPI003D109A9A